MGLNFISLPLEHRFMGIITFLIKGRQHVVIEQSISCFIHCLAEKEEIPESDKNILALSSKKNSFCTD